jgi:hypothetical protein
MEKIENFFFSKMFMASMMGVLLLVLSQTWDRGIWGGNSFYKV